MCTHIISPKCMSTLIANIVSAFQVLVRLAWHASGTYDKDTKTGGSNGATMRFAPESDHGANAGLKTARELLEPVKRKSTLIPMFTNSSFEYCP